MVIRSLVLVSLIVSSPGCVSTSSQMSSRRSTARFDAQPETRPASNSLESAAFNGARDPTKPMPMPDASGAPGKVLSMDANNGATTLAKNRFTRKIKMVYRIDLFKHNAYAQSLANVMKPHEDRIRACYTDRLEKIPGLSGGLGFNIWLKKEVSAIHQIKRTSGSIKDKPLIDCLVGALRRMPLHSPANMRGRLDYVFNVVEQQIAAH